MIPRRLLSVSLSFPRLIATLATALLAVVNTPALGGGGGAEAGGLSSGKDYGSVSAAAEAVQVQARARHGVVKPGDDIVIAVTLTHAPGFHTWPAAVTELPGEVADFAIRTAIEVEGPDAVLNAGGSRVQWPIPHPDKVPSPTSEGTLTVPLYSGDAVAFVALRAPPAPAEAGEYEVALAVSFQACDEAQCLMPELKKLKVKIKVDPAAAVAPSTDKLFAAFREVSNPAPPDGSVQPPIPAPGPVGSSTPPAATPAAATPATATSSGAHSPPPAPSSAASTPGSAPAASLGATIFGFNIGSGVLVLAFFAAIGGFVLNLTPCVLPVIPIKVMTLTQHAASKRHALVLGSWMALGVVAFWAAVGIPMAFISASLDPSRFIFGVWWVTLTIGLVVALMGLGIMGLFTFNLPQAVYMVDAKADSPFGSFLFGVLTAVLGLPCFGFVAGGLLAGAATLPPVTIMAIFVGLGVGMAAPYLVLSVWPQLLRFIPRTGPASQLVKQVMGLLLLAAAAFFIAAGIKSVLHVYPYLAGSMTWWAVAFFVLIAGLWLTIRTWQISHVHWPRLVMPVLSVAMVGGIYLFASGELHRDRQTYLERQAAAESGKIPTGVWLEYTPELFAAVRKSGKAVFLDFTADWCINCKVLKRTLLDQNPTRSTLAHSDVVLMEVDLSSRTAPGWKLLSDLGRTGIPTWVIHGPGARSPIVLDLTRPTHATVEDGLGRAGVAGGAKTASTALR